jgi:viroplasmin and RNaseH domain-containing protein
VDCHKATNGYRRNSFKSFSSLEEAEQAWLLYINANKEAPSTRTNQMNSKKASSLNLKNFNPQFDPPLFLQPPLRWLKTR